MTKTVFAPSISTRPVYGVLEPHQGSAHLMVADGEGEARSSTSSPRPTLWAWI
ncbi:hypothetical protein [Paracoccus cavernae]|uniref:hypothetical protein n=1 Tax=Paracoccus cavernae TaxID=1571207 RepID=UPI003644A7B8